MWPWILIAGIAAAVLVVFAVQRLHPDVDHMLYPRKYGFIVKKEAKEYDLPQSLVYAGIMDMARTTINVLGDATGALFVSKLESDFDPEAESPVGALGLMQMMPETFDWMQTHIGGEYDASALLDPEISIKYGCALLRVLLNEYDNLATAVCAYNAGMGNVTSWLSDPAYSEDGVTLKEIPFEETRLYVQKVLQYKETYEKLYGGIENG